MASQKIIHRLIRVKGKLKPVCDPQDKTKWLHAKAGQVNCSLCLSGRTEKSMLDFTARKLGVITHGNK